jgi:polysaccharide transporter, PST family
LNRKLWQNVISLYSVQFVNYFIPLITLPFLARVLGPSSWGALAFSEAYAGYVSIVVEYGFGLSASRTIAQSLSRMSIRSRCVTGVISAQLILIALAAVLTLPAYFLIPSFAAYRTLIPLAFCLGVARAASPFWYFQGLERMPLVSVLNFSANLFAACGMLLFVRHPKDAWIPIALRGLASAISFLIGFAIVFRETPGLTLSISEARRALVDGSSLFLFRGAISLYTIANVLILGAFRPAVEVAWYAGAEKIARAAINVIQPLCQAFYPRVSNLLVTDEEGAARALRLSAVITISLGVVIGLVSFFAAPFIVRVAFGPGFEETVLVLKILSLLPPLVALNSVYGLQWMLAMRLDGLFNRVVLIAGAMNIVMALIVAPRFGHIGMAVTAVLADIGVASGILLSLRGSGKAPWRSSSEDAESLVGVGTGTGQDTRRSYS